MKERSNASHPAGLQFPGAHIFRSMTGTLQCSPNHNQRPLAPVGLNTWWILSKIIGSGAADCFRLECLSIPSNRASKRSLSSEVAWIAVSIGISECWISGDAVSTIVVMIYHHTHTPTARWLFAKETATRTVTKIMRSFMYHMIIFIINDPMNAIVS